MVLARLTCVSTHDSHGDAFGILKFSPAYSCLCIAHTHRNVEFTAAGSVAKSRLDLQDERPMAVPARWISGRHLLPSPKRCRCGHKSQSLDRLFACIHTQVHSERPALLVQVKEHRRDNPCGALTGVAVPAVRVLWGAGVRGVVRRGRWQGVPLHLRLAPASRRLGG